MNYDLKKLDCVQEAVRNYMCNRFWPSKSVQDVLPNFDRIANSNLVTTALEGLEEEDRSHYLREGIKMLLEEGFLEIRRRGELKSFRGDGGLDAMFSSCCENEKDKKIDYIHLPRHLGYGTPYDASFIWQDYDLDDI